MEAPPIDPIVFRAVGTAVAVSLAAHAGLTWIGRRRKRLAESSAIAPEAETGEPARPPRDWAAALSGPATLLATGAGMAAMSRSLSLNGPRGFGPQNAVDWPLWIALVAAVAIGIAPARPWRRGILATLIGAAGAYEVLALIPDCHGVAVTWSLAVGGAIGLAALGAETALAPRGAFVSRIAITISALGTFMTLMFANSFDLAYRGAAAAAAVGAPLALAWWGAPAGGLPTISALPLALLCLLAYALTSQTDPSPTHAFIPAFALAVLAPSAAWIARIPPISSRPRLAAILALVAITAVAVAGVAWIATHQPVKDEYGY
jgi:hypothetical protein